MTLQVEGLTQTYSNGNKSLTVLKDVSFAVSEGETCAIVGPSGSGKTTLLGLCAGLDRPTSGSVVLDGVRLNQLDEEELARIRNRKVGFVFQTFQLIPTLSALENVMVPIELRGDRRVAERATRLLQQVGLEDRLHHYPIQLSGGEQQRVALARAFVNGPRVLFADEPTGNLDGETSRMIVDLMFALNRDMDTTLLLVTHDPELAERTERVIKLRAGQVISDTSQSHVDSVAARPVSTP